MVEDPRKSMMAQDAFAPIANHYDAIMAHVDYARWLHITTTLGEMLPPGFRHLDAGCGTGVLVKRLAIYGWHSVGLDFSEAMLRVARNRYTLPRLVRGDFRALPFNERFLMITCLFDSLNFLLEEAQFAQAMQSFYDALQPGGLFYFDIVTERMIASHFENTSWTENHGRFRSAWVSTYARQIQTCETRVRINSGDESITYERVYPLSFIQDAVQQAGFSVLAMRDAATWRPPRKNAARIDFVAVKGDADMYRQAFKMADKTIKRG